VGLSYKRSIQSCKIGCLLLNNAIRKYGPDNFDIEVICECEEDEMDYYETNYIEGWGTLAPNGYNLKTSGIRGRLVDEVRGKMRIARTGKNTQNTSKRRLVQPKEVRNITSMVNQELKLRNRL
jgi:hypothetical protein